MTERIGGIPIRVSEDVPRGEIWLCQRKSRDVEMTETSIRVVESWAIKGKIINISE